MNPDLLLTALRAHFRVVLLILGVTVLTTTVVSLLLPKTYVATAALLVDSKDEQSMNTLTDSHVRERVGYMQTQVDIITSPKVAGKVIRELKLAEQPEWRAAFERADDGEGRIEDWLVAELMRHLKVDTSQSSVIRIEFGSPRRPFSAEVANAFARAYMETALELRVEPSRQAAAWFDEQMKGLRANLEQAQQRLTDYQKAKDLVDERFDIDSLALSDLANQVVKAESRRFAPAAPEVGVLSAAPGLRAELMRSESKLEELATGLGENHPAYQRQLAETRHLRARLQAETARPAAALRGDTALRGALAAQQARVLALKQYRYQVGMLSRDVEIAQKAYETAFQHAVDTRVESRASQTNISLLHGANAPLEPSRPRIALNIALSAIVGLLSGLCVVYLMELRDQRVRSPADLGNVFQVPILAELGPWPTATYARHDQLENFPTLPRPG